MPYNLYREGVSSKMFKTKSTYFLMISALSAIVNCQMNVSLAISQDSFRKILRALTPVPKGRRIDLNDVRINFYRDSVDNYTSHQLGNIRSLLSDQSFDLNKRTVLYTHGYVEIPSDYSVVVVIESYIKRGGYNILVLDWANLAFGDYMNVLSNIQPVGHDAGKSILTLLQGGLNLKGLHLVGHSMGAHVLAALARFLKNNGYIVPRLTCLDAAGPGFYPPMFMTPVNADDAEFVDIIHTDSGRFGAPGSFGHVDFWPNGGVGRQPGCFSLTIPLTVENFCSHDRSWLFWAESVRGGKFLAKRCSDYIAFRRGRCNGTAYMGLDAVPSLRGNFYLRTATKEPFALGERGIS